MKPLSSLGTSVFCEDLAMMFSAGIQSDEAVGLLAEDGEGGTFSLVAKAVEERLALGDTLADAMEGSGGFPLYATNAVRAGEIAGRTEASLHSIAAYYAEQNQLESRLKSAVIYPMILLFIMAAILIVMVTAVLPIFQGVYENLAGEIATSSYSYIAVAGIICWIALIATLIFAVLMAALTISYIKSTGKGGLLAGMSSRLPFLHVIARQIACARFTAILETFLASGLDVDDAMSRAVEMVENASFGVEAHKCFDRMQEGAGLAQAIYETRLYEPLYARMLLAGSRSGKTDEILKSLARLFYTDARDLITRLINTIEPTLAGFLTVAVGLALIAVMLPLIGIMGGIG